MFFYYENMIKLMVFKCAPWVRHLLGNITQCKGTSEGLCLGKLLGTSRKVQPAGHPGMGAWGKGKRGMGRAAGCQGQERITDRPPQGQGALGG